MSRMNGEVNPMIDLTDGIPSAIAKSDRPQVSCGARVSMLRQIDHINGQRVILQIWPYAIPRLTSASDLNIILMCVLVLKELFTENLRFIFHGSTQRISGKKRAQT